MSEDLTKKPVVEIIGTGGHSPPVVAFVEDLPFLWGTDAEGQLPLALRLMEREKKEGPDERSED